MKTKTSFPTINIITLGCSKNIVDSERLLTQISANNRVVSHESSSPHDIVVINTCGFIEKAKQESVNTILEYAEAKAQGKVKKIYVTGCLSQRYKSDLANEVEQVDGWFGTMDQHKLLEALQVDYKKELLDFRSIVTPHHYAYLKISEGCDRPCSFCSIPLMRGKHQSKTIESLVTEANNLVDKGVKELLIIAQDSTYYGLDIYKKRVLASLLEKLSDIKGLDWIRLHYAFPTGFPTDILEIMQEKKNICNYLDIPLQHASSKMLQLMRRGTNRKKTERLLDKIRNIIPNIAIRTTMIVGHPQETDKDFEELLDFVKHQQFDRLGAFTYSHEEGTHAHSMVDDVPEKIKEERYSALMELQTNIAFKKNQKQVNTIKKVLVDAKQGNYYIGRTESDSPEVDNEVFIVGNKQDITIGDFVNVKIEKAEAYDLYGSIVKKTPNIKTI